MLEKSEFQIIADIRAAEQYDRRELESMQKSMQSLRTELDSLKEWKRACDNMNKIWLRVAMILSMVATSVGVFMDNIKILFKAIISWSIQ